MDIRMTDEIGSHIDVVTTGNTTHVTLLVDGAVCEVSLNSERVGALIDILQQALTEVGRSTRFQQRLGDAGLLSGVELAEDEPYSFEDVTELRANGNGHLDG